MYSKYFFLFSIYTEWVLLWLD